MAGFGVVGVIVLYVCLLVVITVAIILLIPHFPWLLAATVASIIAALAVFSLRDSYNPDSEWETFLMYTILTIAAALMVGLTTWCVYMYFTEGDLYCIR